MSGESKPTCPNCGTPLDAPNPDAPGTAALCPACLMSGALRDPDETFLSEARTQAESAAPPRAPTGPRPEINFPHELGDYTLVGLLGRGGMGTVYEAVHRPSGRRLALKLLDQRLDAPEMRRRFLREGRLAARVNHEASLYVFGSEEIDGTPVITMEIAPGGTLQDALNKRGPMPVTDAVDATLDMIDGLEAALDRGVLHRDIKPSNCFLAPDGRVKVGDFGLSVSTLHSVDTFVTQTGKVLGTPAFASPEQLRGDDIDARSDIYAVGATLFTLLTARPPFEGANPVQVVANVIDTPAERASRVRDDLPQGLDRVIARCLAKEPAERYPTYAALRDALLPFSSVVPEPATQTQRTAAGWVDFLTAFLPAYATLMVTVGPETLLIRPMYDFTLSAWRFHLLLLAIGFLYFTITEGVWGTGLGKWIMNLRVVRTNGRRPGFARALLRIAFPIACIEGLRIPLSLLVLPAGEWSSIDVLTFVGLSVACPWVVALLWLTARRSNGLATAWDLVTGTRVVVRPRGTRRPVSHASAGDDPRDEPTRTIGPFTFTAEVKRGSWLSAEDPVLRRRVWLMRRGAEPIADPRRSVARSGRPRWLQEVRDQDAVWDAFEAPRGAPLAHHSGAATVPWSTLRFWLHDVADELRAAERDGTIAHAYTLDHVWITDDGRAVLLDAPWPRGTDSARGADPFPVDTLAGKQRFLQALAERVAPRTVPLHAKPVLDNIRSGSFEKSTFIAGTLRGMLSRPADVGRGVRAASLFVIPGYAWAATFIGIASNTDPNAGPAAWVMRILIAALVMMNIIAAFDLALAFWSKSTGLSTFGLEAVTPNGRASGPRMLLRTTLMWLPVVAPSAVLASTALARGTWIDPLAAAVVGAIALAGAAALAVSSLVKPSGGLHDRIAGVWITRR